MNEQEKYRVIQAADTSKLTKAVNAAMAGGWIPTGGIAAIPTKSGTLYSQAIIEK